MVSEDDLQIVIKPYSDLSLDELYEILRIRESVFQMEQGCWFPDLDGLDRDAWHLICRKGGKIEGILRIFRHGIVYPEASLGRIIALERGSGIGRAIVSKGIRFCIDELGEHAIRIHAQEQAKGFYEKCGFVGVTESEMFEGRPHLEMLYHGIEQ